jgi:hypothetical protein
LNLYKVTTVEAVIVNNNNDHAVFLNTEVPFCLDKPPVGASQIFKT